MGTSLRNIAFRSVAEWARSPLCSDGETIFPPVLRFGIRAQGHSRLTCGCTRRSFRVFHKRPMANTTSDSRERQVYVLNQAAEKGDLAGVKRLLDAGLGVNDPFPLTGFRPLISAAAKG